MWIDKAGNYYEGDRQGEDLEVPPRPSVVHGWDGAHWAPDPALTLALVTNAIQQRLDAAAQAHGYDGILSAATYAGSGVPRFNTEGQYARDLRDATWLAASTIMADVQAGNRPLPTVEDVLAELPAVDWPV